MDKKKLKETDNEIKKTFKQIKLHVRYLEKLCEKALLERDKADIKNSVIDFFKKNPGKYFSAFKINEALGIKLEDDIRAWKMHAILLKLKAEGKLEQLKGKGFKYKNQLNGQNDDKGWQKGKKKWDKIHDLKVYLAYRRVKEGEDKNMLCEELAEDKGFIKKSIPLSSIKMRIGNFEALDSKGKEGLSHCSKQSRQVFEEFKDKSIQEIEKAIKEAEKVISQPREK